MYVGCYNMMELEDLTTHKHTLVTNRMEQNKILSSNSLTENKLLSKGM